VTTVRGPLARPDHIFRSFTLMGAIVSLRFKAHENGAIEEVGFANSDTGNFYRESNILSSHDSDLETALPIDVFDSAIYEVWHVYCST
jgi:hypothetical protein